jgi:regulator of sirC expression with transglutaminase-like and TPR domain
LGFRGNVDNYFDPRNSFLNQVLDRRIGIPITLSVLYLELARRLDLPFVGIGLPGHFIVRYDGDAEPLYLDPFYGGVPMTQQECRQRIDDISQGRLAFKPSFLDPLSPRQILTRMLRNLKAVYVARTEFEAAVTTAEKLVLLNPSAAEEMRDLGVLHYYAGHKLKAIGCLHRYMKQAPKAEDLDTVQHNLGVIIEKVARWN